MTSRYQIGSVAGYNGGHSPVQGGAGLIDWIKKGVHTGKRINDWAKKNQVISKIGGVADAVGATGYINDKTGGKFGQVVNTGKQKGYGKRKPRKSRK